MNIKDLKDLLGSGSGVKTITDPEEVYWSDLYPATVAYSKDIDIRQRGRRKPILIGLNNKEEIIIEWDYGRNQWIIHTKNGILGTAKTKSDAVEVAYNELRRVKK